MLVSVLDRTKDTATKVANGSIAAIFSGKRNDLSNLAYAIAFKTLCLDEKTFMSEECIEYYNEASYTFGDIQIQEEFTSEIESMSWSCPSVQDGTVNISVLYKTSMKHAILKLQAYINNMWVDIANIANYEEHTTGFNFNKVVAEIPEFTGNSLIQFRLFNDSATSNTYTLRFGAGCNL